MAQSYQLKIKKEKIKRRQIDSFSTASRTSWRRGTREFQRQLEMFGYLNKLWSCQYTSFIAKNAEKRANSWSVRRIRKARNALIAGRKSCPRNSLPLLPPVPALLNPAAQPAADIVAAVAGVDVTKRGCVAADMEPAAQTARQN
jgi:hypothetical protein